MFPDSLPSVWKLLVCKIENELNLALLLKYHWVNINLDNKNLSCSRCVIKGDLETYFNYMSILLTI